jgi:hypothetical protein
MDRRVQRMKKPTLAELKWAVRIGGAIMAVYGLWQARPARLRSS